MNRSHLLRLQDDLSYKIISINLEELFNGVEKQNILLNYMDKLTIYNNNKLSNINSDIYISGPIKNPGYYPLSYNETLGDLIIKSGGLKIGLNKIKISIARVNPVSYKPEIFYFPSKKDGNSFISISNLEDKSMEMNNFQLKAHDIINIYPDPRDRLPGIVSIAGAVYFPGDYPISSNNEKVTDIITRAGGLMPEAYPMASSFIRGNKTIQLSFAEMLKNPSANNNFSVIHGDSILIRTKPNSIEIIGEVNNPGIFKYYKNLNMMNYINIAGGLTVNAEKKEIWVSYPDGTSKQLKNLLPSPRMYDGSSITVGKQVESDPIDKTELAKEIASIISDFLNIYISLTILARTADSL